MSILSKSSLALITLILIIVVVAVVRFLVHELIRFVEISAVLVLIILALAWLLARRAAKTPKAEAPGR